MSVVRMPEIDLAGMGERFRRIRGDVSLLPDATIAIPVNAQGDLEKVLSILADLSSYTGKHTLEIVLVLNNYPPQEPPLEAAVYRIAGIRIVSKPDIRRPGVETPIAARMLGVETAVSDVVVLFDADCRIVNATELINWYMKQFQSGAALAYTHVDYYELADHWSVALRIRIHHFARWLKRVPLRIPTVRGSNYAADRAAIYSLYRDGYLAADLNVGMAFKATGTRIAYSNARNLWVLTSGRMFTPRGFYRLYRYFSYRLRYNLRVLPVRRDAHRYTGRENEPVRRYVNGRPIQEQPTEYDFNNQEADK